jgi:hypothetical protein
MLAAVEIAESWGEHASLWAIRLAVLSMFMTFALQLRGWKETSPTVRNIWFFGAINALVHSVGALLAFHGGSHQAALQATAAQTQELMGFSFGAGLYFNYVFVLIWLFDATARLIVPQSYSGWGLGYRGFVYGFLGFIAFNGTVVFKSGWIQALSLLAMAGLLILAGIRWRSVRSKV